MKIVALIQARMSSTRLPGKVLMPIAGKPMLLHVVQRVKQANQIDEILIATSNNITDDPIVAFCRSNCLHYFRGSLEDVLDRYYNAAKFVRADVVIRLTGDCPLVDPELISKGISLFTQGNYDYVSNKIEPNYLRGFEFEIIKMKALEETFLKANKRFEREHVTPYIWHTHPEQFLIKKLDYTLSKSQYRMTVDTAEDMLLITTLIEKYRADEKKFNEIIHLLDKHPELVRINQSVVQKHFSS